MHCQASHWALHPRPSQGLYEAFCMKLKQVIAAQRKCMLTFIKDC
jgi:hypothetical protein